jgi:diamine N-acetyltransferase
MQATTAPVAEFRRATPQDALCVGVLAIQVFLDTYATHGIRPDVARQALANYTPESFAKRIEDPSTFFILVERGSHLLGFAESAIGTPAPTESLENGMELVRLYVPRHAHREGLGSALLARTEALAMEKSVQCLWLTAWSGNASAIAFYAARGYVDIGATSYVFEGNAYENRIFKRSLVTP